jgi:hypothetical protein
MMWSEFGGMWQAQLEDAGSLTWLSLVVNKYTFRPPCSKKELERAYFDDGLTQSECGVRFGVSQKVIWSAMRRYGIKARVAAKRDQMGENNHMWKGDAASKQAFHRRLYSRYGKPEKCAECGTEDPNRSYDYANLTGRYEDLGDYKPMCRSCHWRYDMKIHNINHMRGRINNAGE